LWFGKEKEEGRRKATDVTDLTDVTEVRKARKHPIGI
jgi:hypothetical protein